MDLCLRYYTSLLLLKMIENSKRKIKEYNEDRSKYTVKAEATSFRQYAEFWMKTVKILHTVNIHGFNDQMTDVMSRICKV